MAKNVKLLKVNHRIFFSIDVLKREMRERKVLLERERRMG